MAYFTSGGGVAASQQFGLNQTDVFSVDQSGRLNVSWVVNAGWWQGPQTIGPANLAPAGSFIAASRQFGIVNQTDAFVVDNNGQLNVMWVVNAGLWGGPGKIGPVGLANPGCYVAASQQFGIAGQTDVFLVDKNGQLNVFWVDNAGAWGGPGKIGPAGLADPGSYIAVSQQFGLNQTDVFLVDKNGQLNVFWVDNAGAWAGPEKIGPAGLAAPGAAVAASQQFGIAGQTDVFLVDKNDQLNVFWVVNAGAWNGPEKIGPAGIANSGCHLTACQQFGINSQTDVFLVDKNGQLNVFWVDNAGAWNGPGKIGPAGNAAPGASVAASQQFGISNQTDVFLIDKNGQLNVFWVDSAGVWNGPQVKGNPVAAPGSGLGSNSNYLMESGCNTLSGVSVTMDVQQDITGSDGFGFQLNAYSAKSDYDAAQQYLIYLAPGSGGGQLTCMVDNWTASNSQIINVQVALASLPSHTLPAGYQLKIELQNDSKNNITGAVYTAIDNHGNSIGTHTITVPAADIDPIVAFQLDFVDYLNGGHTTLSSGAGNIIYSASNQMTPSSSVPSCVDWSYITVETANSAYGTMASSPAQVFTQSFGVAPAGVIISKTVTPQMVVHKTVPSPTPFYRAIRPKV